MISYEEMRDNAILCFAKIYKDSLACDMAEVPKEVRIRLLEDQVYLSATKKIKAEMYSKQLKLLQDVIDGQYSDPDKGNANEILKALDMRNKILFDDLNVDADESNALNITMIAMTREDFEKLDTVDIHIDGEMVTKVSFDDEEFDAPKSAEEVKKGRNKKC